MSADWSQFVPGEIVYDTLKSRAGIEQSYDAFKNTIHGDRTYTMDDYQMQGWTFVNFLTPILHCWVYGLLKERVLLRRYTHEDVLEPLELVNMLRKGEEWRRSEIPRE